MTIDTIALAHVRELAPEAFAELERLDETAWACIEADELELCRLAIAALLGDERGLAHRTPAAVAAGLDESKIAALDRWRTSDLFTSRERARLDYTEQFVVSVSSVEDDQIEALLAHDDHVRVYEFTMAVYVLDMTARVGLMTDRVLSGVSA